jgi:hypothetical protein
LSRGIGKTEQIGRFLSTSETKTRNGRADTELRAKEVKGDGRRYIVCRNLAEAAQAARTREAVLTTLRANLGEQVLNGGHKR